MRRSVNVLAVVVVLATLTYLLAPTPGKAQPNALPVTVTVDCPDDLTEGIFSISVSPYEAVVVPTQGIKWTLENLKSTDKNIRIEALDNNKWPYAKKNAMAPNTVEMTDMRKTQEAVYQYKITVFCNSYSNAIVLDPRVRVGGGGSRSPGS